MVAFLIYDMPIHGTVFLVVSPCCLTPENMGVAVGISLLSCIRAEFPIYFRLMVAIFDLRHAHTWNRIPSSLSVLPEPGNMGVAVGISLLSCIRAEIYVFSYLLPVNSRHL